MKLIILTNSKNSIPQKLHETESLNIEILKTSLLQLNWNVSVMTFDNFINNFNNINYINGTYFIYASSQYESYQSYIEDILLYIQNNGGILIPNFNIFRSHENKFFQELVKRNLTVNTPKSYLVGTIEEGIEILKNIDYPIIAKEPSGFGSKGVYQINNEQQGINFLNRKMISGVNLFSYYGLRNLYVRFKYKGKYPKKIGKLIFQEKIEQVDHDWKVLVFENKCFCLKRSVRKNDFRASGSGIFDFSIEPPKQVLDFAYKVKNELNTPWVSLDIIIKDDVCYLIEYQGVHFGLSTAINNSWYYELNIKGNKWEKKKIEKEVEYYFSEALVRFIERSKNSERKLD
ncbi:hypothetical protein [Geobacillus sp. E263]|uniref:ATP-grasp domain-containing protein n=1 Tax=Geobacillus sp. E263 TaxID=391290 RepID=UPI00117A1E75|nr:hypothetical protein [Geobacillus sp. E263]